MKFKTQYQALKTSSGFSLLELLVVLLVLSILGLVAVQLFTSALKGTNKAAVISEVKQNGQFLSDTLERHIRAATDVNLTNSEQLNLATFTGLEIINFVSPCGSCNPKKNGKITLNGASITNTDPLTGVDVSSATFTILPQVGNSPKVVQIDITLNQGILAPTRREFQANVHLVNTYSLRTY